jgi:hypothetical protein
MLEAGGGPNRGREGGADKPFESNQLQEEELRVLVLTFSHKGTAVIVVVAVKFKPICGLRE